jgi:hypothetical protein
LQVTNRNDAPVASFKGLSYYVNENSPTGTQVVDLTTVAYDEDSGDSISFALVRGNTYSAFNLTSAGLLLVKNSSLNYESKQNIWNLTIRVTDTGIQGKFAPLSTVAWLLIRLLDVNEAPSLVGGQSFFVYENATVGTVVGTIQKNDPDSGQNYFFSSLAGTRGQFVVFSSGQLAILSKLNFRTRSRYAR